MDRAICSSTDTVSPAPVTAPPTDCSATLSTLPSPSSRVLRKTSHLKVPTTAKDRLLPVNVAVCCDGTGNNATSDTNVYRTYLAVQPDQCNAALYICGPASTGSWWDEVGKVTGWEVRPRVVEMYQELCLLRTKLDRPLQLFFFGFSRGAYIAGVISQCVQWSGLRNYEEVVGDPYDKAFSERILNHSNDQKSLASCSVVAPTGPSTALTPIETASPAPLRGKGRDQVAFIGLWDMVAKDTMEQLPESLHLKCPPAGTTVAHALALHERRADFVLVRIGELPRTEPQSQKAPLIECWFPGSHGNVGQLFPVAAAPLVWMWGHASDGSLAFGERKLLKEQELRRKADDPVSLASGEWAYGMDSMLQDSYTECRILKVISYPFLGLEKQWRNPSHKDLGHAALVHIKKHTLHQKAKRDGSSIHDYTVRLRRTAILGNHIIPVDSDLYGSDGKPEAPTSREGTTKVCNRGTPYGTPSSIFT